MDRKTNVTYRQLDRVLRTLGFSRSEFEQEGKGVRYEHKQTGAAISLPLLAETDHVFDHHLLGVRMILDNFGVADPSVFEKKLQKAG